MMRVLCRLAFAAMGGLIVFVIAGTDAQGAQGRLADCTKAISQVEQSYQADLPSGRRHSHVEAGIEAARRYCSEGKFNEAKRALGTAAGVCRMNNGCAKK
jgi:hypothetical protein